MSSYEPIWIYPPQNPQLIEAIIAEFNIHPATAQILVSRGFKNLEEIHEFLYAKLPNLFDPDLFPEIDQAVERVLAALQRE